MPKDLKPAALRQFTIFRSLPTELRLKIWNFATANSRSPRVIKAIYETAGPIYETLNWRSDANINGTITITSIAPPPVLHVNQEAREFALKQYSAVSKTMATSYTRTQMGFNTRVTPIYQTELMINFERDTICLIDDSSKEHDGSTVQIKKLAGHTEVFACWLAKIIEQAPKIKNSSDIKEVFLKQIAVSFNMAPRLLTNEYVTLARNHNGGLAGPETPAFIHTLLKQHQGLKSISFYDEIAAPYENAPRYEIHDRDPQVNQEIYDYRGAHRIGMVYNLVAYFMEENGRSVWDPAVKARMESPMDMTKWVGLLKKQAKESWKFPVLKVVNIKKICEMKEGCQW